MPQGSWGLMPKSLRGTHWYRTGYRTSVLAGVTAVSALAPLAMFLAFGEFSGFLAFLCWVYALSFGLELPLGVATSGDGIAVQQRLRWCVLGWDEISGFELRPHYLFTTGFARLLDGSLIALPGVKAGVARLDSLRGARTILNALNHELEDARGHD